MQSPATESNIKRACAIDNSDICEFCNGVETSEWSFPQAYDIPNKNKGNYIPIYTKLFVFV